MFLYTGSQIVIKKKYLALYGSVFCCFKKREKPAARFAQYMIRGGADKSLARPTSRCRRTESTVSLERGVCLFMWRIVNLHLLHRLKGSTSGNARDFNNMEMRAVIKSPPPLARQGAEGNSHHSDRNFRGTGTIVCHRQKLSGPV